MDTTNKKNPEINQLFTNAEAWEPWESKLVWGSIITAIVSLGILGIIINHFLLK